jgi:hypothetical protein
VADAAGVGVPERRAVQPDGDVDDTADQIGWDWSWFRARSAAARCVVAGTGCADEMGAGSRSSPAFSFDERTFFYESRGRLPFFTSGRFLLFYERMTSSAIHTTPSGSQILKNAVVFKPQTLNVYWVVGEGTTQSTCGSKLPWFMRHLCQTKPNG